MRLEDNTNFTISPKNDFLTFARSPAAAELSSHDIENVYGVNQYSKEFKMI